MRECEGGWQQAWRSREWCTHHNSKSLVLVPATRWWPLWLASRQVTVAMPTGMWRTLAGVSMSWTTMKREVATATEDSPQLSQSWGRKNV